MELSKKFYHSLNKKTMPTGYTANIEKGITFNEFVLGCARSFGALIDMRDEPNGTPIPDEFIPNDYHYKEAEIRKDKLCLFDTFTLEDAQRQIDIEHKKALEYNERYINNKNLLKWKYEDMLAKAKAWEAPTPEHEGLKKFMIEQITTSIEWDCGDYRNPIKPPLDPETWIKEERQHIIEQIEYHEKKYSEEIKRCKERSAWVKELKKSLGI